MTDNAAEKEVEEKEREAERAMAQSAGSGAQPASSSARRPPPVTAGQVPNAAMDIEPPARERVDGFSQAPLSFMNTVTTAAGKMLEVVRGVVAGSSSSSTDHWAVRPKEETENTTKEWAAGEAAQQREERNPPSARSGASSSQQTVQAPARMEVEAVVSTPEELERDREAVHEMRPSLKMLYSQVDHSTYSGKKW